MSTDVDPFAVAKEVADTVLYEGYVLYPYRASSAKNRTRWQFGVLMPPAYAAADDSERAACVTELVFDAKRTAVLRVRVRFLHVVHRTGGDAPEWDETVEREFSFEVPIADVLAAPQERTFSYAGSTELADGVTRVAAAVEGAVRVTAVALAGPYAGAGRLTVEVANRTPLPEGVSVAADRDEALQGALVAAHTMLALEGGVLLSMTEPPEWASVAVKECRNVGTWPVLVGREVGSGPVVLSSPIILGDNPEIAPESPGDLYDATEIDEILTLRTMTLTDAEKAEARATDPRAAALIDRVDDLPQEHLDRLHGALRYLKHVTTPGGAGHPAPHEEPPILHTPGDGLLPGPDLGSIMNPATPWWDPGADSSVRPDTDGIVIDGVRVAKGSRVRLRPGNRRTDAQDLFMYGRVATVEAVFFDVDGAQHLGVTLDDDPELADISRQQGRFLYFAPDEVEPVSGP
jgi:hypothetical protein